MSVWGAAAAALAKAAAEAALVPDGRLVWTIKGSRCFVGQEQIAVTHPGRVTIVHEFPGVPIGEWV